MFSNHLNNQNSPYLLQHLHNPVDWYPWSYQAFEKAKAEDKPIFLSIGYSSCHWCHVMAHESFENEDIARILNDSFVSIKVDREERPDIDQIYMSAASMINGQVGWPLSVFLTTDAKPFYAGTYFPPYPKWGSPGFIDVLNYISNAWKNQKEQIYTSSEEITKSLVERNIKTEIPSDAYDCKILDRAFEQISYNFDTKFAGFGSHPKFPMGHQLSFLLHYFKRSNNNQALIMVEKTLEAISKGGIYDQLGGGIHRYSTDEAWHIPHFEKMLYDQALLVKVLLEAYQITGNKDYVYNIRSTLDYVMNDLKHPMGGFYTAQDADSDSIGSSHKSEGAFYVWTEREIQSILNNQQFEVFKYIYGIQNEGNASHDPQGEFLGKNILYIKHSISEAASEFRISLQEIESIISHSKDLLIEHRKNRPRPYLDDKILTDWNGLMIGVFAQAGGILNEPRYTLASIKATEFILNNLYKNQKLLHTWCKEKSSVVGMLNDYAFFIHGLLDLYEITLDIKFFNFAIQIAETMILLFEDKQNGGFFLTSNEVTDLILRPKEYYDGAIPSGNSCAINILNRLYHLTSDVKWIYCLEQSLKSFIPIIEKAPSAYTFALSGINFYFGPTVNIVFEGQRANSSIDQMKKIIYKYFIPNKTIFYKNNQDKFKVSVCNGGVCKQPTSDAQEFEINLLQ